MAGGFLTSFAYRHAVRLWNTLCLIAFIVSLGYAVWLGFKHPFHNWDMVAYIAAAVSLEESDPVVIHERTMAELRQTLHHDRYKEYAEKSPLSNEPYALVQQLPGYLVKPLYVGLIWAVQKAGLAGYAQASWSISAISFALLACVLALWRPRHFNYGLWLLAMIALTWVGMWPMNTLPRFSTPDALGTLLFISALYFLMHRRNFVRFAILAALSMLVRPDYIILIGFTCGAYWLAEGRKDPKLSRQVALAVVLYAVLHIAVQKWAGSYGWATLFYNGFIYQSPYPADMEFTLTFEKYLGVMKNALLHITADIRLLPFIGLSALAGVCYFLYPCASRLWPLLLAAVWASYTVRFALAPVWWDWRYYFVNYIVVIMACAEMSPPYLRVLWRQLMAHRARIRPASSG